MDNRDLALKTGELLSLKKAEDVIVLGIAEQSSFADYFINATAMNERQLSALADEAESQLAKEGIMPKNIEGRSPSGWILMDYGDVIVNVFLPEQRDTYRIEKVWGDSTITHIE